MEVNLNSINSFLIYWYVILSGPKFCFGIRIVKCRRLKLYFIRIQKIVQSKFTVKTSWWWQYELFYLEFFRPSDFFASVIRTPDVRNFVSLIFILNPNWHTSKFKTEQFDLSTFYLVCFERCLNSNILHRKNMRRIYNSGFPLKKKISMIYFVCLYVKCDIMEAVDYNDCSIKLPLNFLIFLNGIIHLSVLALSIFISGILRWKLEVGQPTG